MKSKVEPNKGGKSGSLRPSQKQIGLALARELQEIIDRMGENHPNLSIQILRYVTELDERHPDWRSVMERVRDRQLRRLEAHLHRNS